MTIDEFIAALESLREAHGGDVDVTVWQYGGGLDDLCNAVPVFDPELGLVVLETTEHESLLRR